MPYESEDAYFTTTLNTTTTIPIPFQDFSSSEDLLFVDIEGIDLAEGVDYTFNSDDTRIVLNQSITHVGTKVHFRMLTPKNDSLPKNMYHVPLKPYQSYSFSAGETKDVSFVYVNKTGSPNLNNYIRDTLNRDPNFAFVIPASIDPNVINTNLDICRYWQMRSVSTGLGGIQFRMRNSGSSSVNISASNTIDMLLVFYDVAPNY